ncbi:Retrovirus-related Pol polyprotein from transposon TNT 1-94 [Sesbania bispinosa]|nr:Retrovirus-related Pol polyprotein from transposon TNT 1-94 [Sesbania bispinosa]
METKEVRVQVPLTSASTSTIAIPLVVEPYNNQEEQQTNDPEINNELVIEQPQ